MSDFASQVSEKDHNEVSDFVPFEVSDFAKSVSEKVLFSLRSQVSPFGINYRSPAWAARAFISAGRGAL